MSRGRLSRLLVGAGAGAVAALAMTLAMLLLRSIGVPLPLELVSDRFIPLLPVDTFLRLVDLVGGFVAGKRLGFYSFFLGQIALGAALGALYALALAGRAPRRRTIVLGVVVIVFWLGSLAVLWPALDSNYRGLPTRPAILANALVLLLLPTLLAVALVAFYELARRGPAREPTAGVRIPRGAFLTGLAGGVLAVVSGVGVRRLYDRSAILYDGLETRGAPVDAITPNDRFYVVTKNFVDPRVDHSLWRLEVTGSVEQERSYDWGELNALAAVEQETTLECISNGIGAGLISNARWGGVPLRRLLEPASVRDDASFVMAYGVDGFAHGLSLETALRPETLVAFRMNGEPLPDRHGYPARLIVPGGYGELSVKWLTRVELLEHREEGFYESQGWRAERVHTMSRIDRPLGLRPLRAGRTHPVNGIAFAGDRGIRRVELSTDGGRMWRETRLDYRGTPLTWALWSFDWTPDAPGRAELVVRATDGTGALQSSKREGISPDGASGYHRIEVEVVRA
jgi:DMSO/TMAO reductase YedYZ molybdopterin-dependent catalytic subunit